MSDTKTDTSLIPGLYPVEEAILYRYFKQPLPERLEDIDFLEPGENCPADAVHLEESPYFGYDEDKALANAVARLLLAGVQNRLPNWGGSDRDGNFVTTRVKRLYADSGIAFLPLHLCTINWADSAPGFSWPEEYWVTWVPGFNRNVVTASRDTCEGYGYADEAIGWFDGSDDRIGKSAGVIEAHWQDQWCHEQQRWTYLFYEGAISAEKANEIADRVWADIGDEDEWDGDELQEEDDNFPT